MIIAINPMLSNTQLNSDSNYVYLSQLLPEIIRKRPNWVFWMFWPTGSNWKYYDDGFFKKHAKNVVRIPKKWQEGKYRAGADYDIEFFYNFFASNPVQLIWNNTVEQTPVFLNLRVQSSETWAPSILNFHHFPVHHTLPGINENYVGVKGLQSLGTALGDKNIYNSKWCQQMMKDTYQEFLNLSMQKKIENSGQLIYMGPINDTFPETRDYSKPVFLYNHRIAGYKNWDVTFGMFDKLWAEGLRFEVLVTTVDASSISRISTKPYVKAYNCFTREQYLAILPRANINVSNSQHETFCISMVESMAAGHACLGPNRVTFPELFQDGGGAIFHTDEEQLALMRNLITLEPLRREMGEKAKKRARDYFTTERYANEVVDLFEKTYEANYKFPNTSKAAEIEKAIKALPPSMEFMPAYRQVQRDLGWMNQAFPILYFCFVANKFGKKFSIKNNQVWVVEA